MNSATLHPPSPGFAFSRLDPLFYAPLVQFRLPDAEALNALLIQEIAAIRAADPGISRSNRMGWHSQSDLFARTEPGLARIAALMRQAAIDATRRVSTTPLEALAIECEGWINVNPPGGLNAPHDHPGWFWSGAYYVAVPQSDAARPDLGAPQADRTAGFIEFIDGRTNLRVASPIEAPFMASKLTLPPEAGQLVLFPSHLQHWVYPNAAPGDRISIAFNARFGKVA